MLNRQLILDKLCEIENLVSKPLLNNFEKLINGEVFYKNDQDEIVTQIDLDIEKIVINFLKDSFPDAYFISEETPIEENGYHSKELIFIIDPIDGTSNYFYGVEYFSVSIGVMSFGEFIGGIVVAPMLKKVFFGMKDCGAYYKYESLESDDSINSNADVCYRYKSNVVEINDILRTKSYHKHKYLIGTTYPCINLIYNKLSRKVSVRVFGSIALTISYALTGKLDGMITNSAKIWDIAAAIGIANAMGFKFLIKQKTFNSYSLILHRRPEEIEKIKELLGF
jgi:myo-inositol-1(or 4)-monophosphatase